MIMHRLSRIESDHHSKSLSTSPHLRASWSAKRCPIFHKTGCPWSFQPPQNRIGRWTQNRLPNPLWPLWIFGHAFWTMQCPRLLSRVYQWCHSRMSRQICSRLPWWHIDLFKLSRGAYRTCPSCSRKTPRPWPVCQARKMRVPCSENQFFGICHFPRRYFYGSRSHIHHLRLTSSSFCYRCSNFSGIRQFLSSLYWWLLSCGHANYFPPSDQGLSPLWMVSRCARSLWSSQSPFHLCAYPTSFRSEPTCHAPLWFLRFRSLENHLATSCWPQWSFPSPSGHVLVSQVHACRM